MEFKNNEQSTYELTERDSNRISIVGGSGRVTTTPVWTATVGTTSVWFIDDFLLDDVVLIIVVTRTTILALLPSVGVAARSVGASSLILVSGSTVLTIVATATASLSRAITTRRLLPSVCRSTLLRLLLPVRAVRVVGILLLRSRWQLRWGGVLCLVSCVMLAPGIGRVDGFRRLGGLSRLRRPRWLMSASTLRLRTVRRLLATNVGVGILRLILVLII